MISGKNDTECSCKWLTSITKGEWVHCQTAIWRPDGQLNWPKTYEIRFLSWKEMCTAQPPGNAILTQEVIQVLAARSDCDGRYKPGSHVGMLEPRFGTEE